MSRWTWSFVILAAVAIMAGFYYFQRSRVAPPPEAPPPAQAPQSQSQALPQTPQAPQIQHPLAQEQSGAGAQPLPSLDGSDQAIREALATLIGLAQVDKLLDVHSFVRHLVITVDNLPREKVARPLVPLKPVPGRFFSAGEGDAMAISAENYRRYTPGVHVLEALDPKKLVDVYVHFYPLFQQAYKELGYPSGYFNDRLIDAIDDMLAAPQIQGPVRLVRPKLMYQYADPALEDLSAGQKILIRMGPDNEARVKAKLNELRQEIISRSGTS